LQGKSIERIGGKRPIQTDVRILAATNADLETKIKAGRFREDLYYRIDVVSLNLPPAMAIKARLPSGWVFPGRPGCISWPNLVSIKLFTGNLINNFITL
jgi:hypothetical protein